MSIFNFEISDKFLTADENFEISIKKIGQEHCLPRKKFEIRKRKYNSLHIILYGKGVLKSGNKTIPLNAGMAFFLFCNEEYEYYPNNSDPWSYIWIDFNCDQAEELFYYCGFSKEKPYIHLEDFSEFVTLSKQLYNSFDASETQQLQCSAYFMLLISKMITCINKHANFNNLSDKYKRVRDILIFINNNYRLDLKIETIAEENYISVSYMMALFSDTLNMSPVHYLNYFRISSACELLVTTDYKIEEISGLVGFSDWRYFTRVFKKIKEMTPREYKNSKTNEDPFKWLKEKNLDLR